MCTQAVEVYAFQAKDPELIGFVRTARKRIDGSRKDPSNGGSRKRPTKNRVVRGPGIKALRDYGIDKQQQKGALARERELQDLRGLKRPGPAKAIAGAAGRVWRAGGAPRAGEPAAKSASGNECSARAPSA
jgi:hypothetical protein